MKYRIIFFIIFSFSLLRSSSAQILVEAFRSIGCVNCVDPDRNFENFMSQNPGLNINIVYYHNNIATSDDPFYAASKADVDYRMGSTFYRLISDPDVFVSGFDAGATETKWETLAKDPASAQYLGTLTAQASVDASGQLIIDLDAGPSSSSVQVKPYVMLVESGISYTNTEGYGNPPNNIWNNVFRAMIPGPQGDAAFTWSSAQHIHYMFPTTGKPWVLSNCKIYAILQEVTAQSDKNSHAVDAFAVAKITQAGVSENNKLSTSISAPIPNPCANSAQIPFNTANPANVKIVVYDDLGRDVQTIYNQYSEGSSFATFTPNNLSCGIYYARMYVGGEYVGMQKIVFAP